MPSMRAVLAARQKAAAVRVEDVEAELERVRAALAEAEEVLGRRMIGREQYLEALAEEEVPAEAAVPQRKPVSRRRAVPHRQDAAGTEVLSVGAKKAYTRGQGGKSDGIARHLMPLSTRQCTASIICRWQ
jgi:hypothetical protein